jgi:hypothetical protein
VCLSRKWGDRTRVAVGLFEPTSLEPLRLLELGDAKGEPSGMLIDDMFLVTCELERRVTIVIDPRAERAVASFTDEYGKGHPSLLFDRDGHQVWRSPM